MDQGVSKNMEDVMLEEKVQNQSTVFDNSLWSIELEDFVVRSSAINNAQRKSIHRQIEPYWYHSCWHFLFYYCFSL